MSSDSYNRMKENEPSIRGLVVDQRLGPIEPFWIDLSAGSVVIYGRNGSGKSHLMREIAAFGDSRKSELFAKYPFRDHSGYRDLWDQFQNTDLGSERANWQSLHWERMNSSEYRHFSQRVEDLAINLLIDFSSDADRRYSPEIDSTLLRKFQEDVEARWEQPVPTPIPRLAKPYRNWVRAVECASYANFLWTADDDNFDAIVAALLDAAITGAIGIRSGHVCLEIPVESHSAFRVLLEKAATEYPDLDELFESTDFGRVAWEFEKFILYSDDFPGPWRSILLETGITNPQTFSVLADIDTSIDLTSSGLDSWFADSFEEFLLLKAQGTQDDDFDDVALILQSDETARINPIVYRTVSEIVDSSNRLFHSLLEQTPTLGCTIAALSDWHTGSIFHWHAIVSPDELHDEATTIEFDSLSWAERRWAAFSIRYAMRNPFLPLGLIAIDEPERGLHRRAERILASRLDAVARSHNATLAVTTHSPAFFELPEARLHHLRKSINGFSVLESLPAEMYPRIDELGISRTDLLQLCRLFLIVEGEHDLIVLTELIGDELSKLGVIILPLRGLRNLTNSSDAQVIFRYTDAKVMFLSDNENSDLLREMWTAAQVAQPEELIGVLGEYTQRSKSPEMQMLKEFAVLAVSLGEKHRIRLAAHPEEDILDYLPPEAFGLANESWGSLRRLWREAGAKRNFKNWLSNTYGVTFDSSTIRSGARALDYIPEPISSLLDSIHMTIAGGFEQ